MLGLANIGGIGGGGLVIPLAIGCWGFSTPEAVAISNSTVFLSSLIRFFGFSIYQKHPNDANRTIIDYNVASIMIPAVLLGGFAGLYITAFLPEAITMILLTVILLYMTYNTFKKMIKVYQKELRELESYTELSDKKSNISHHESKDDSRSMDCKIHDQEGIIANKICANSSSTPPDLKVTNQY